MQSLAISMDSRISLLFVFLLYLVSHYQCHAWYKSTFKINSKLPQQCGNTRSYNPENRYEVWGTWPWMGIMEFFGLGYTRCGCILIHPQVTLAALLCIKYIPEAVEEETLFVSFSNPELPTFQNISVTNVAIDGEYNSNIIALLKLKKPAIISPLVAPICLWREEAGSLNDQFGFLIGSDFDVDDGETLKNLRYYQASIKIGSYYIYNNRSSIKYRYVREQHNTCHSPGSIMVLPRLTEDGTIAWFLRGINLFRTWFCNREGDEYAPFVYDLISSREWILSHFKPSVEAGCGRRVLSHTELIIKGDETVRGDWPWHAAIYIKGEERDSYICGGSLISQTFVLTAAHCVVTTRGRRPANTISLLLGKHTLNAEEPGYLKADISEVIVHNNFEPSTLLNDIALLKLTEKVTFTEYIQPGCLWDEIDDNKNLIFNSVGTVVGWGFTEESKLSNELKSALVPIVHDIVCFQSNNNFYSGFLRDSTFCAGNPRGNGTNVCNGDSGGSLMLPITQSDGAVTWFIRGIVSLAPAKINTRLCDPFLYAVFTDVTKYKDWINANLQ